MNLYATLDEAKRRANISGHANDALFLELLEEASRKADAVCNRHFYTEFATRRFDLPNLNTAIISDVLSVSSIENEGEEIEEGQYTLEPYNKIPYSMVSFEPGAIKRPGNGALTITGVFGFGDGRRVQPLDELPVTATIGEAGEELTVSSPNVLEVGMTIRIGIEDMYVRAVSGVHASVERAVNGTEAVEHSGSESIVYQHRYPAPVKTAVLVYVARLFTTRAAPELIRQRIGDYEEQRRAGFTMEEDFVTMLKYYKRIMLR